MKSETVKPSIVNAIRVEMELDAHELINDTWGVAACPSCKSKKAIAEKTNWFRVGMYSLILGLCIALSYVWRYQSRVNDNLIEILSAPRMQVIMR